MKARVGADGDFISPLVIGATALHENMLAFIEAGFTRPEALHIVVTLLTETIRQGQAQS